MKYKNGKKEINVNLVYPSILHRFKQHQILRAFTEEFTKLYLYVVPKLRNKLTLGVQMYK